MNCPNCAAVMKLSPRGDLRTCGYCGTTERRFGPSGGVDRITPSGDAAGIDCPTCDVELVIAHAEGCRVCQCPQCDGFLVTGPALRELVEVRRSKYTGLDVMTPPDLVAQSVAGRSCPRCDQTMDVHPYYGPGNATVEDCGACGEIWLDAGLLTQIEVAPGRRRKADPLSIIRQEAEDLAQAESDEWKQIAGGLVDILSIVPI